MKFGSLLVASVFLSGLTMQAMAQEASYDLVEPIAEYKIYVS